MADGQKTVCTLIMSGDQGILMPAPTFYTSRRDGWAAKSGAREEPHRAGTTTVDVNKTSKGALVSCSLLFYYLHIVRALFSCKQEKPNWLLPSSRSGVTALDTSLRSNLNNPIPHSSSARISPLSLAISGELSQLKADNRASGLFSQFRVLILKQLLSKAGGLA